MQKRCLEICGRGGTEDTGDLKSPEPSSCGFESRRPHQEEICDTFNRLIGFKSTKELDISVAKIIEYCITRDEKLLKPRAFSDVQKTAMYNKQEGICPICGQHYRKPDMQAHHIIPWYDNGITEISNGVLLCNDCHKALHAGAISFDFSKK